MKKFLITLIAVMGISILAESSSEAAGGWFRRRARFTYAPAPSATVAQSQAGTGYRTYSYQPAAPTYRSYQAPKKAPWEYPKTDPRRYGGTYQ